MKNTLEARIAIFSFVLLFLTIFVHSALHVEGYRRDYINALMLRSKSLATTMKESVENVLKLGLDLKEIVGVDEKCRALVQANPEIAYCVITDLEGIPLFLNDQSFYNLRFTPVTRTIATKNGQLCKISFGDGSYYDTDTAVTSPDGRIVARIHVGFSQKILMDKIQEIILRSLIVLVAFVLIAFTLVVLVAKKSIMLPVSILLHGVKRIAEGALDTRIQRLPVYEFNELATSINSMAESLSNREEQIRANCEELATTNKKIHSSYLKLESLSLELERSEELYKSLMEDSSDAIIVIDGKETVKKVNKMAEDFFGYTAKEMEGLPLTKLLLLLDVEEIPQTHRMITTAASGGGVNEEMHFSKKQGGRIQARFNANCIKSGPERLVQTIFRDVTKENETLANLEKSAADLARLNKMKDSFLGLASHELKTPLTVIMGYSELILTEMSPKVDDTVLEMVKNISTASARLDNIVKDMVDVSLIDERRLHLKLDLVDLNELIEASVKELSFFFSMRKQDVQTHLDRSIPLVRADSLRVMQLLSNIFGNAIKFTPDGGTISVTTSAKYLLRSHTAGQEQSLYVEIMVKDTGIGIDRDEQFRIFDKFYEVGNIEEHSTGKVAFKAKGAGLGLAIAKGIVEMHGGEIWVESAGCDPVACHGSTFHIFLPIAPIVDDSSLNYMNILR